MQEREKPDASMTVSYAPSGLAVGVLPTQGSAFGSTLGYFPTPLRG
jgi:hypothetical protein